MEGHNWFSNQFDKNPRRSIIVYFSSLLAKAGLNHTLFEISCSWPPSLVQRHQPIIFATCTHATSTSQQYPVYCSVLKVCNLSPKIGKHIQGYFKHIFLTFKAQISRLTFHGNIAVWHVFCVLYMGWYIHIHATSREHFRKSSIEQ